MKIVTTQEYKQMRNEIIDEVEQMPIASDKPLIDFTGGFKGYINYKKRFDIYQGIEWHEKMGAMMTKYRTEKDSANFQAALAERMKLKAAYLKEQLKKKENNMTDVSMRTYLMEKLERGRYCELAKVATDFRKQYREEEIQQAVQSITGENCAATSAWTCIDTLIEWSVSNKIKEAALKQEDSELMTTEIIGGGVVHKFYKLQSVKTN